MNSAHSIRFAGWLLCVATLTACGGGGGTDAADVAGENAVVDVAEGGMPDTADPDAADVQIVPDVQQPDVQMGTCGSMRPDLNSTPATEGLVIARDGTIYFSEAGGVGRVRPDGMVETGWVTLSGATTVWGLALDRTNQTLFVGSPVTRTIYRVNVAMAMATPWVPSAGAPNGLTLGPDGALYYSDFSGGHVYRANPADGSRMRVTATAIMQPNGVAFHRDGSLYVDSYGAGTLLRLELTGGMESNRTVVAMNLGNPDGLAFDAMDNIYVGDNGGRLIRLNADGTGARALLSGIPAMANIEFGIGALSCTDIYFATGVGVRRYTMGTTNGAAVPWH